MEGTGGSKKPRQLVGEVNIGITHNQDFHLTEIVWVGLSERVWNCNGQLIKYENYSWRGKIYRVAQSMETRIRFLCFRTSSATPNIMF